MDGEEEGLLLIDDDEFDVYFFEGEYASLLRSAFKGLYVFVHHHNEED